MRYIILLLTLSGCTLPAYGAFPDFGAKEACQESMTAIKHHWNVCEVKVPDDFQRLWDDCDHAVSATFHPITSSQMEECLIAIDMVSCDGLDQSNPPECVRMFFHP